MKSIWSFEEEKKKVNSVKNLQFYYIIFVDNNVNQIIWFWIKIGWWICILKMENDYSVIQTNSY